MHIMKYRMDVSTVHIMKHGWIQTQLSDNRAGRENLDFLLSLLFLEFFVSVFCKGQQEHEHMEKGGGDRFQLITSNLLHISWSLGGSLSS